MSKSRQEQIDRITQKARSLIGLIGKSKRGKSRKPLAIKRAIARLLFEGRSLSAIGRELGIDRQTASRNSTDPVVQAEIQRLQRLKLECTAPPRTTAAASRLGRDQQPRQLPERHWKIPLHVVPLAERRRAYLQLQSGEVSRETMSPDLLAAVDEYIEVGAPAVPPDPAPAQPQLSAQQERRREEFQSLMNGAHSRSSSRASGRRTFSTVPPWLRPKPNLDWDW